jgi:MFS family permease
MFEVTQTFEEAGVATIQPQLATIIVGTAQVIGSACSNILIDRWGRKPLLILSTTSISVGLIVFGVTTQLFQHGQQSIFTEVISIISLTFVVWIAFVGIYPLTFVVLSEITPENVSTITSGKPFDSITVRRSKTEFTRSASLFHGFFPTQYST